jgi:hypothetical protein
MSEWFDEPQTVPMVRYECQQCDMQATCVANPSSSAAWADHMATHANHSGYMAWTWAVLPLPFVGDH